MADSTKLVLYYFCVSQPSRSIKLLLDEAGIEHEVKVLNLMAGEQKSEEFLKVNPGGQVPVLVDGDFVLPEGAAILEYIASKHNLTSWLGEDARTKAKVHQWMHWHHSATRKSTTAILRPVLWKTTDEAGAKAFADSLAFLEKHLSTVGPFLAGTGSPTIADLLILPEIDQLSVFGLFDLTPYPKVAEWSKAVQAALPRSYPPNLAALQDVVNSMK